MKPSLKIHDPSSDNGRDAAAGATVFDDLSAAFARATGWLLRLRENQPATTGSDLTGSNSNTSSTGIAPGTVSLELSPAPLTAVRTPRRLAESLAKAIARMLGEVASTRHALWQREAELAAGVPVAARPAEPEALAERLDGILRGGCEALDCTAAALYLLDAGTTELKLRSAWGLARYKLAEPPRPLRGATADLEALTGHAVVLANAELCALWHAPEAAEAALCVPVASPSMPLGTLWFFASHARDFDDRQTQLAEIVAGRLAADLEREVLLGDAAARSASDRRERSAACWTRDHTALPPLDLPGWSIAFAPCAERADAGGADQGNAGNDGDDRAIFADCFLTEHDTLAVVLGASQHAGPEGQMAVTAVRTAVRAHAARLRRASAVLDAVHQTVSAALAGDLSTSLAVALVHPNSGWFHFAATGDVAAAIRRAKRVRTLRTAEGAVGGDAESAPATIEERGRLAAGEQLVFAQWSRAGASTAPDNDGAASRARFAGKVRSATGANATQVLRSLASTASNGGGGQILVLGRGA